MSLKGTVLMSMVTDKMSWLTQRQRVLSQNVANADTPDYKAKDLRALDFRESLRATQRNVPLRQTSPMHVTASTAKDAFQLQNNRSPYEISPDGNRVVLEEQMFKLNETQNDYQLATRLFRKYGQMYKVALGRPGGQ